VILLLGPLFSAKLTAVKFMVCVILMFVMSLSLVSIGLIVASIMKSFEGFQTIMTFLIMPMFFLSGALFPMDKIPSWMSPLIKINPLTYGVDALRTTLVGIGYHSIITNITIMLAAAAATMVLGSNAFKNAS